MKLANPAAPLRLIPLHAFFNLDSPGVNAACHRLGLGETLLAKPGCDLGAALAVVTITDQPLIFLTGQFLVALRQLTHGQ